MSMEQLLHEIAEATATADTGLLKLLVACVRPAYPDNSIQANQHLHQLNQLLRCRPDWAHGLRLHIKGLLTHYRQIHLYTDTGILGSDGFSKSLRQRLGWKLLPPLRINHYLKDVFGDIFPLRTDHTWLQHLDGNLLIELFDLLFGDSRHDFRPDNHYQEVLAALAVISFRITAIGLEPELIRNYPAIEDHDSPFIAQNRETTDFADAYRGYIHGEGIPLDDKHVLVLLDQCTGIIGKIRKQAKTNGITVDLTYLLHRLEQHIRRMQHLLALLDQDYETRRNTTISLLLELVSAENTKHSMRHLLSDNLHLLSRQVTDNASKTGEHYVCTSRPEFFALLRSAMGAGLIIPVMALLKILTSAAKFAPFGQAFFYSLNYAFGFMLIHMLHFTVATKQPAMTAANMAAAIEQIDTSKIASLNALSEQIITTIRSQFIAIIGNISIAFPVAYLIAWLWHVQNDTHLVNNAKAYTLLHELNPFTSLALFHAAIAGVCLFLTGLISGYYDNKAVYHCVGERLRQRPALVRLFGNDRLQSITMYLENNLGALAGNFYFGIMLGSIGTLGFILGLPIDIRHIAFSSANFAYAVVGLEHHLPWETWLVTLFGVLAIGFTNLAVSFSLALIVALKARGVRYQQWPTLLYLVGQQFLRRPRDFFWPPKSNV